jgi:dTDP-4-amino-4,6-dideoxygalactose transaminase
MRLSRSIVGRDEAEAVSRVIIEDGYLGMGREVDRFEAEIAEFLGVPRSWVACVNSGTAAVHLAVESVMPAGGQVLVPSLTFVATFQGISAAGAVPVACDVRLETATLDLNDAARRLTANTKAIMPVHYASYPADYDAVCAFAASHGLRVIEDAAHAFGCTFGGRKIGSFGDVACFSFDGIKNITSGEGGLVVSRDERVMERVRDARLLGVTRDTEKRYRGERSWEFDVEARGYRFHMSNLFAAIGRVQLRRFAGEFAPIRVDLARRYRSALAGVPGIALFDTDLGAVVPHIQPIRVLGGRRDRVREQLREAGIETGIHYKPNHLLTYFGGGTVSLPCAERLYSELLSLPLHPGLTADDVTRVSTIVVELVAACPQ